MSFFVSIIALSFIIFFHELGHFLAARACGVRVLVFSLGFGYKIFKIKYKDTIYCLSLIPLGGYVKLNGETQNIESNNYQDSKNSLNSKHPLQKILIFIAGPLFNIILAFLIYIFIALFFGIKMPSDKAIVGNVSKDFAAFNVLKNGDEIISINDIKVINFNDIRKIINADSKNIAKVVILRKDSNQLIESNIKLSYINENNKTIKILGISPSFITKKLGFLESLNYAFNATKDSMFMIYDGLKKLIIGVIGLDNLSSIIGITDMSSKAYQNNFVTFLFILAIISINLGVINILPLPMLDGGQIIFALYEWIFHRPLNTKVANILIIFGISFVICIMSIGIFNDISRILNEK